MLSNCYVMVEYRYAYNLLDSSNEKYTKFVKFINDYNVVIIRHEDFTNYSSGPRYASLSLSTKQELIGIMQKSVYYALCVYFDPNENKELNLFKFYKAFEQLVNIDGMTDLQKIEKVSSGQDVYYLSVNDCD